LNRTQTDVVVLGCGVAGTAISLDLARRGLSVTVAYRREDEGSSFSNQKWKHSGALYPVRSLALAAWRAYQSITSGPDQDYLLGPAEAHFFSDDPAVLDQLQRQWDAWGVSSWGLDISPLPLSSCKRVGAFGRSCFVGGFRTPDCVIDFPSMIQDLRAEMRKSGVGIEASANVKQLIREGNRVTGVVVEKTSGETHIQCRHCVVAMGAWAPQLLKSIGLVPPVRLTKSNVLVLPDELVDRITVWIRHEVTIVPYRNRTLIADARFMPVDDPDDLAPHWPHVDELVDDLSRCFPDWRLAQKSAYGCLKTAEMSNTGIPNPNVAIYVDSGEQGYCHGVTGLTVVFPGKASLMWTVAQRVGTHVARLLDSS